MQDVDIILRRVSRVCWIISILSFGLMYFGIVKQLASFLFWSAVIVGFTIGMIFNIKVLINKFRKND
jgi:hypothetical protein